MSFFLSILGLIGAVIFRNHNYIRNYKVMKKGAIAGLIVKCAIVLLFLLALFFATR